MKYYYWLIAMCVLSILMYLMGSQDNMSDVVASCNVKNTFIADGVKFVCISEEEYFNANH